MIAASCGILHQWLQCRRNRLHDVLVKRNRSLERRLTSGLALGTSGFVTLVAPMAASRILPLASVGRRLLFSRTQGFALLPSVCQIIADCITAAGVTAAGPAAQVRRKFLIVGVLEHLFQNILKILAAINFRDKVTQLIARFHKFLKWFYLPHDRGGFEVGQGIEFKLNTHFTAITGDRVFDTHIQPGRHALHDIVEIIPVNLHKLTLLEGAGSLGLPEKSPTTPITNGNSFDPLYWSHVVRLTRGLRTRFSFC
jgi:hypothetical protein